jgi:hypothetical protein
MSNEPIRGKVARVLNSTDLALNRGSDDGVSVGMRFAILSDRGADITDPDSGLVLDSIEIAKTLVKIISVTEHLCVGRTFRSKGGGGIASALSIIGTPRNETLHTDERRLQQELDPKDSFIKVGDEAVQYTGEDYGGIVYDF